MLFFDSTLERKETILLMWPIMEYRPKKAGTEQKYDLALVDLKLPDTDGITLLKEIKDVNPDCEVVIITGYSTIKSAVEAMKMGLIIWKSPLMNWRNWIICWIE